MTGAGPAELASTIQAASINRHPDPTHDLNPSSQTTGTREPVVISPSGSSTPSIATDEVPLSALRPLPKTQSLPPLPDLRFEQSYLRSLEGTEGWMGVGWITVRDQVILPLVQGMLWTLVVSGWRHWNKATNFSGQSVGARLRRWWWQVNKWEIPSKLSEREKAMTREIQEFYEQ